MQILFPRWVKWPLIISLLLLNAFFVFVSKSYIFLYYPVFIGIVGYLYIRYRSRIKAYFDGFSRGKTALFIVVGYLMVMIEETIAGFVHFITYTSSPSGFIKIVGQFWAFNLIVFTGFILAWYFASRRYQYSVRDVFILAGLFGLFSEHVMVFLASSPITGLLIILPSMCTYTLMISPAILVNESRNKKSTNFIVRYLYVIILLFVLSIPPVVILSGLRSNYPNAFPPCDYIPCGNSSSN